MRTCDNAFYADQAAARLTLSSIQEKAATSSKATRVPVRVYPCDVCDGWHLTAKPVQGRKPPWDRDPDWVRPGGTAQLQARSREQVAGIEAGEEGCPRAAGFRSRRPEVLIALSPRSAFRRELAHLEERPEGRTPTMRSRRRAPFVGPVS